MESAGRRRFGTLAHTYTKKDGSKGHHVVVFEGRDANGQPAGVGKADSYDIGGSKVAEVNPIFDLNKNGQITAGEFRQYYARRFPELS